ncbi:hypothetical protein ACJX0J_014636, partial [Zea mays]
NSTFYYVTSETLQKVWHAHDNFVFSRFQWQGFISIAMFRDTEKPGMFPLWLGEMKLGTTAVRVTLGGQKIQILLTELDKKERKVLFTFIFTHFKNKIADDKYSTTEVISMNLSTLFRSSSLFST